MRGTVTRNAYLALGPGSHVGAILFARASQALSEPSKNLSLVENFKADLENSGILVFWIGAERKRCLQQSEGAEVEVIGARPAGSDDNIQTNGVRARAIRIRTTAAKLVISRGPPL
jgi:hypothetical protein